MILISFSTICVCGARYHFCVIKRPLSTIPLFSLPQIREYYVHPKNKMILVSSNNYEANPPQNSKYSIVATVTHTFLADLTSNALSYRCRNDRQNEGTNKIKTPSCLPFGGIKNRFHIYWQIPTYQ